VATHWQLKLLNPSAKALLPNRLNKIAQNTEFTKSLPKSAIEKILPEELASLELASERFAA
jgi:hypothetical protein